MTVLVLLLILGLATLAGGQVWVVTGSVWGAASLGACTLLLGSWLGLAMGRRRRRARFLGEVGPGVDLDEFSQRVDGPLSHRDRVQQKLEREPERVADSIRSMLDRQPKRGSRSQGTRTRKAE